MRRLGSVGKITLIVIGIVAILVVGALIAARLFEDRLRAYAEAEINQRVSDYVVQIGGLKLRPLRLGVDLLDVTVKEARHPEPPILLLERATTRLRWSSLLRGRVFGDLHLEAPTVHVTGVQLGIVGEDVKEQTPSVEEQQAWQDQVLAMMPVAFTVTISNGTVTYEEQQRRVLRLTELEVEAGPIKNVRSDRGVYPSPISMRTRVQNGGTIEIKGQVDPFAKPHAAGELDLSVRNFDLKPFAPVADRYHVALHQGRVALEAHVQYAPWVKDYDVRDLTVEKVVTNYIYEPEDPKPEKEAAKKGAQKAEEVAEQPETVIRVERARISESEFGVVHAGVDPPYRVFLTDTAADLKNFSTRLRDKAAQITATGRLMASGTLEARGVFRPDTDAPDFDLSVKVEETQIKMFNDLLRAHGGLDVAGGDFSVYSQFNVERGRIDGYVKPIIRNLNVYDRAQERGKGLGKKIYEGVVGGAAELLTNRATSEAGTEVHVTGTIANTELDTWQAAVRLLQNAFFQVVVPRFDRPVRPGGSTTLRLD